MEIIGKTDGGYLCNLSSEEIKFIATGEWSGDMEPSKMLGRTVKLHELFERSRIVERFKTTREYQSVREQLEDLLTALSKVEKFVEKKKKAKT